MACGFMFYGSVRQLRAHFTLRLLQQRLITRLPLGIHFLEKHVRLIGLRYDGVLVLPHKGMAQVGHSTKTATNPIMALAILLFDTC